jgi:hypothetical protein
MYTLFARPPLRTSACLGFPSTVYPIKSSVCVSTVSIVGGRDGGPPIGRGKSQSKLSSQTSSAYRDRGLS